MSPQAWQHGGTIQTLNGHDVFTVDSGGGGPVIIALHGFPTSSWDWAPLWPALRKTCRLLTLDFLGFGFSEKPHPHAYSIMEQADLVEALLARSGIRHAHVLAHDYGDTVAQELLARDLERVPEARIWQSCCLLNGGIFPEAHRPLLVQRLLSSPLGPLVAAAMGPGRFNANFKRIFGPDTQPDEAMLEAFWRLITTSRGRQVLPRISRYRHERKVHRCRWVAALTQAPCPMALINGSADPISGDHMVQRYAEIVRADDPVTRLPRIGHYPHIEAPDAVAEAYLAFLGHVEAARETS